jgi:lysophospholipase L1-like esterase
MTRLLTLILAAFVSVQEAKPDRWEADIQAFEKKDRENPPPQGEIVFAGSSTMRMWKTADSFPDLKVINRGFGGSQMADSVKYADRIILPYKPRIVVVYAGTNDLAAGKTPEKILEDWEALVKKIHDALPKTRILFIATKPTIKRWAIIDKQRKLNGLVAEQVKGDKRLGFIETGAAFLGDDGKPRADLLLKDGLHLNPEGYKILSALVRPYLVGEK